MFVYCIKLTEVGEAAVPNYDYVDGFVVRALSESRARGIAARHHGCEDSSVWTTSALSRCQRIGVVPNGSPHRAGVVLQSFNAG